MTNEHPTISDIQESNQPDERVQKCYKCGTELLNHEKFCPKCGKEQIDPTICKKCGAKIAENQEFCPVCGKKYGTSKAKAWTTTHKKLITLIQLIVSAITAILVFIPSISGPIYSKMKEYYNAAKYWWEEPQYTFRSYDKYITSVDYSIFDAMDAASGAFIWIIVILLLSIVAYMVWKILTLCNVIKEDFNIVSIGITALQLCSTLFFMFWMGHKSFDVQLPIDGITLDLRQDYQPELVFYIFISLIALQLASTIFMAIMTKKKKVKFSL